MKNLIKFYQLSIFVSLAFCGHLAQAKLLICSVTDVNSTQILAQQQIEFTDQIAFHEIAKVNEISFQAGAENKQVSVGISSTGPSGSLAMSLSKRKKARIATELNGLKFDYRCEIQK